MTDTRRHDPTTVWTVPDAFRRIYSHAVEIPADTRLLLVSGQIGIAPDGTLRSGFADQCAQAIANVEALLAEAGLHVTDIVKATYYLTRATDLPLLTALREQRWSSSTPPAVTTLVVAALARPELLVEIEVMAAAQR
ncbi:MAG: RidA family protein [Ferrovibrio sp.]|uniref:RidA family protein n=1 Tax=Ferrovibrio sp. TaxID=1917215 RepID=UPI00263461B5|nr:RidA family protein [Ferrovibrio sp.]MCW0234646.1 RidA family protein [Ferrovibrio sp.]